MHKVGMCLVSEGRIAEARTWLERSIATLEQGGLVNNGRIGTNLCAVAVQLAEREQLDEAKEWALRGWVFIDRGGPFGEVDCEAVGAGSHTVGVSLGCSSEAENWLFSAITLKKLGGNHREVDYESLGKSMHAMGVLFFHWLATAEAEDWFKRAVASKQKGDVYGRLDHESIGVSMEELGGCNWADGAYSEAEAWFECAVASKQKGDVYGRVNAESLSRSRRSLEKIRLVIEGMAKESMS